MSYSAPSGGACVDLLVVAVVLGTWYERKIVDVHVNALLIHVCQTYIVWIRRWKNRNSFQSLTSMEKCLKIQSAGVTETATIWKRVRRTLVSALYNFRATVVATIQEHIFDGQRVVRESILALYTSMHLMFTARMTHIWSLHKRNFLGHSS